ncbi:hypothetical protein PGH07_06600 [Sulfurovum sp. zt1-1]|uniref:TerB family tellurite resistance protein n=1 Tax=Sulfurovum zhangzhouensis TaxID=3019067 RepID=A0ABT7QYD6_9BACT|nr:hypothetical protein [Sulfurovum zhangzhouensis]MDM5271841.1 hypothetical protein [Sulfurovum zhangzhouensis]
MFKKLKRNFVKMFRELLVYHHSSLEYRAKILTLMVSSNERIDECEEQALKEIAHKIYHEDPERAELLIDTVKEYHVKIRTNNGLDFEHLVQEVDRESRAVNRYVEKIDFELLERLHECMKEEEDIIFQQRVIEFLQMLKEEYGRKTENQ